MKGMVGFLFFLLFVGGLFFVFLKGKSFMDEGFSGGGAELTGMRWQAAYLGADEVPEDAGLWVEFGLDGGVEGHGGCNGFSGSLQVTDGDLSVGPLAATRMACEEPVMGRETAFLSALQQSTAFEVSGQNMRTLDSDRNLLVEFNSSEAE